MSLISKKLHMILSFSLLLFLVPFFCAALSVNNAIVVKMNQSMIQNATVYYGVHVPGWMSDLSGVTQFEQDTHKSVSIIMWYQGWGLQDGTQNFETGWMNNVRNHGSIPMVTWEPWLYTAGVNQPTYSLKNIINGKFDAYITKWAQDSKAWGHPYFLRFAHEMNGYWYPWSEQENGNSAGQYVQAWRHVHDIFTSVGATNVTWVWSPNVEYSSAAKIKSLYPGANYVDWVGMDGYNWGSTTTSGWQSFTQVFEQTHKDIQQVAPGKPMMIAETASTEDGGNKATWITDALSKQLTSTFSDIKAVIWFNQDKETDWRIESSKAAITAFARAIASSRYASNSFATLSVSPIPVLHARYMSSTPFIL